MIITLSQFKYATVLYVFFSLGKNFLYNNCDETVLLKKSSFKEWLNTQQMHLYV